MFTLEKKRDVRVCNIFAVCAPDKRGTGCLYATLELKGISPFCDTISALQRGIAV
jgi:hypothetical protein